MNNKTDREIKDEIKALRVELLRRQRERAATKYRSEHPATEESCRAHERCALPHYYDTHHYPERS